MTSLIIRSESVSQLSSPGVAWLGDGLAWRYLHVYFGFFGKKRSCEFSGMGWVRSLASRREAVTSSIGNFEGFALGWVFGGNAYKMLN